jgi:octaprenyl-diphosphate synthase
VGAKSAGASEEEVERMRRFGEKVGVAFQIKDDLFDYGSEEIGKPLGIDIKERKMTLPLIYALQQSSYLEKRKVINIIRNKNDQPKKVKEVIEFVKEKGGMEYATDAMNKYHKEAMVELEGFEESIYKKALLGLVDYTIHRKK